MNMSCCRDPGNILDTTYFPHPHCESAVSLSFREVQNACIAKWLSTALSHTYLYLRLPKEGEDYIQKSIVDALPFSKFLKNFSKGLVRKCENVLKSTKFLLKKILVLCPRCCVDHEYLHPRVLN
jgi:hypothetical protein